jgi:hypothetical protein
VKHSLGLLIAIALLGGVGQLSATQLAYEGFDYPNSGANLLISQTGGGGGWDGDWHDLATSVHAQNFLVSQDEKNLLSSAYPFTPIGDRAISGFTSVTSSIVRKTSTTFDLTQEDTLYGSLLLRKDGSASQNESIFYFQLVGNVSDTGGVASGSAFVGIYDDGRPVVGVGSGSAVSILGSGSSPFSLGIAYFMVFKVTSTPTADTISLKVYSPSDAVPLMEPVWDLSETLTPGPSIPPSTTINGVRIDKGKNAAVTFDEIRLGSTWASVTRHVEPGDFDLDGDVDGADFVVWQTHFPLATGATYSQGDADADNDVDGADFIIWQTNFPYPLGPAAVPEPATIALMLLAVPALFVLPRP